MGAFQTGLGLDQRWRMGAALELFVVFPFVFLALQADLIRVISARDMNRDERKEHRCAQASQATTHPQVLLRGPGAGVLGCEGLVKVHGLEPGGERQPSKSEAVHAHDLHPPAGPMIDRLKVLANKRDVPYQSLLKLFVAERIEEEMRDQ